MAITDAIETRIVDAVVALLEADADLLALTEGRIQVGSAVDTEGVSIKPRQINAYLADAVNGLGTTNADETDVTVTIEYFFPRNLLSTEAGVRASFNEAKRIVNLLRAGSVAASPGRLADAGYPTLSSKPYVTTCFLGSRISEPRVGAAAILRIIEVTYQTRENASGVRV
jgi:hypothetical protein